MIQKSNQKVQLLLMLIVLTLTGSMEVKAQPSEWRGMTYNDDVRYSQWIINSRINDFRANSTPVGFGVYYADGKQKDAPTVTSKLDYVPGLVAKAIVENVKLNVDYTWAAPWYYSMKSFGDTYYDKVSDNGKAGKSQDDLNGVKMFFALKDLTASGTYANSTTNERCNTVMGTALSGLGNLNSTYFIGKSSQSAVSEDDAKTMGMYGGWFHKSTYKDEMWCDGLYMGPALLAQLINEYGAYSQINTIDGEDDWDLITRLFTISWNQLYNSSNGLMYHAFAAASHDDYSATWTGYDPANGVYHSAAHWGRACGWYFLALVDILEQMDKAGKSGTTNYTTLKGYLNSLAAGLANYQDATTGCWYQVLDEKDSHLDGNYLESSCTAIFAAAYLKGTRLSYFESDYSTVAEKAYKGCVNQFMMFDENNTAQLIHCCASAGLGKNNGKTRNGSRSYYIEGHDVTQRNSYTEGKVLGGFILAATEYERMYQSDKAILFSTDLKDSYSLENSGTISIEAFGADGAQITYQWYKDDVAVEGATNSTIAPTASGAYYCKATSGTTTIQSSTADVTVAGDDTFTPEFTTNLPATATATEGVAKTLTVAADHVDGYQWYSNTTASNTGGQPISGATEASYTFTPAATGTLYYYCVATNSKATGTKSVASSVCTVTVSEAPAGPTVLYSTDFSNSEWSGITSVCAGKNAANETHNGITFHSYSGDNAGKPFEISQSAGTMTWCNNNMGDNFWIAIPVTGVNGSLTITVDNGITATRFKYATKQETTVSGSPGSGSNNSSSATDPATVTIDNLDKSDYVVYLGRQGSGLTTLTSITITTPAGGDTPTPTTYTVSYNMNGHGEAIADVTNVTALPSTLPTPEATGYTFGGWYTDSGLTSAATAGASISADTELFAKWTANTYSVHFDANGGEGSMTNESFTYGTAKALTANAFTRTGYKFDGWATSANGAKVYDNSQSVSNLTATNDGTVDLYAHWTEKAAATVSITPTSGNVTVGSTLNISSYVTAGNSTGAISYSTGDASKATVTNAGVITGVAEGSANITVTQDEDANYKTGSVTFTITVNAAPTPTTNYTVKFYNGTEELSSSEVAKGTEVEAPTSNPTKEGYTFKGWALESGSTARVLFPYEVWSDVDFYAVWSENTGGGSGEDVNVTETAVINSDGSASSTVVPNTYSPIIETSGTATNNSSYIVAGYDYALKFESSSGKVDISIPTGATNISVTLRSKSSASNVKVNGNSVSTSWSNYATTIGLSDQLAGTKCSITKGSGAINIYCITLNYTMSGSGQTDDITLDAATDYENFDDYVGANKNVTLKRSFTEGKWTTLVLPFSVTAEQLNAAFTNANECEIAKIKSMNVTQGNGSIHYTTVSSIEANKPVLAKIKPNANGEYVFTGVMVVAPTSVVSTSTDGNVEMHGVYKTTGYTQISEDAYFLSGGKFYDWSYLNAMSPFSAYILPVGENAESIQSISFDDEATGIVNVNGNANGNGNANENSYNLAGQRVTKEYNGIVIIKGKKVFTK